MGKRFGIVIGVAAAGAMALGAQTTAAAPKVVKYDTSLETGHKEHTVYHGRVASKVSKCERGRRVVLYKKQPGADRKVGHDRTGKDRLWSFASRDQSRGQAYAKATRERHKGFVCLAARAPTVFFAGPPTDTTALPVGSE